MPGTIFEIFARTGADFSVPKTCPALRSSSMLSHVWAVSRNEQSKFSSR